MGVHYFYTWVTSRYPLIRRPLKRQSLPCVDHLYLDINGVLHKCAKDSSTLFKDMLSGKKMHEIFVAIVNYLNKIINSVKPRQTIFLAIDGVAPRAKMNNQRDRRFRKSFEGQHVNTFMTQKLHMTQEQVDFKSNSISPGTQFMIELTAHIEFFIKRKLHEDCEWRKLEVVFSGGNVAGEGEHKIMDFIRSRAPTQSKRDMHCIYGNDSDLVLLGLKLHLPNVFVLREPNVYVDADRKTNYATKRFEDREELEVLFINLLREYLLLEFMEEDFQKMFCQKFTGTWGDFGPDPEANRNIANGERFLDDFVLLTCLVGNDFLPAVYGLSTKDGHLDLFIRELKKFYEREGVFLVFREQILFANVLTLLKQLSAFQDKFIEQCSSTFKREISSYDRRKKMLTRTHAHKDEGVILGNEDDSQCDLFLLRYKGDYNQLISAHGKLKKMVKMKTDWKSRRMFYYLNYFGDQPEVSDERLCQSKIDAISRNYFEGMEFKHKYYTIGCPSWVWFFEHTLCPLIPDMVLFLSSHLKKCDGAPPFPLIKGEPFRPFVQLLHILPRKSLSLLPKVFTKTLFEDRGPPKQLALKKESPAASFDYSCFSFKGDSPGSVAPENSGSLERLRDSFPQDFLVKAVDNIRSYTWHPLVAHIRKEDMLKFLHAVDWSALSANDKSRNNFGTTKLYKFNPEKSVMVEPTLPGFETVAAAIEESDYDFEVVHGKDARKMDKFYVGMENMLALTRFRSPSFLRRFGGFKHVGLKVTTKKRRNVMFLEVQAGVMKDLLLSPDLESKVNAHFNDISKSKKQQQKPQSLKSKMPKSSLADPTFATLPVLEQNNIIATNLKNHRKFRQDKAARSFVKSGGKKQLLLTSDWMYPTEEVLLDRHYLTKNPKMRKLENILDFLRKDYYCVIDSPKELFGAIDKLPLLVMGEPSFTYLNIKPQAKGVSLQVNYKVDAFQNRDYFSMLACDEITKQLHVRKATRVDRAKMDFEQGILTTDEDLPAVSLDVSTGNVISISEDCRALFTSIDRGENFAKIPTIKKFSITKENFLVKNLNVSPSNSEMSDLSASTLAGMGLNRDQAWVVWVICDSLTVYCDRSKTSSLVLGTKFDVGLNFMSVLNKRVNSFKIVNDMLSLFLERSFKLDTVHGLENLVNVYVKPRYMDLLIMFDTDGRDVESSGRRQKGKPREHDPKRLNDFLDKMDREIKELEYTLEGLVGVNALRKWREKLYKRLDQQMDSKEVGKRLARKKSLELTNGNYRINEQFKQHLNLGHQSMENFFIDKKGFSIWQSEMYSYNCSMLKTVLHCIPNKKFISLERMTLKLFAIYFTKSGKRAVSDYVKENPQIINFIIKRKKKIMKFMWSDRENCYQYRFFSRFDVGDVFRITEGKGEKSRGSGRGKGKGKKGRTPKKKGKGEKEKKEKNEKKATESKLELKSDSKPESKIESKSESKIESKSESKIESKSELKIESKTESKIESKPELKLEAKTESNTESKPDSKTDSKPETKIELKPKSKSKSKPKSKPEPTSLQDEVNESLTTLVKQSLAISPPAPLVNDPNILLFHSYARLLKKSHSSLLLRPALSRSFTIPTISDKLTNFESSANNSTSSRKNKEILVSNLISYSPGTGIAWPPLISTPNGHSLGDRVVVINSDDTNIVFGTVGTVIGEFRDLVEVLLDDPVIGGNDLKGRVPAFRGKTFRVLDLFNLSQWRELVINNGHLGKSKKIWKGDLNTKKLFDQIKNDFSKVKRRN